MMRQRYPQVERDEVTRLEMQKGHIRILNVNADMEIQQGQYLPRAVRLILQPVYPHDFSYDHAKS